jgi:hypothetical protein
MIFNSEVVRLTKLPFSLVTFIIEAGYIVNLYFNGEVPQEVNKHKNCLSV